jgi:hypothetical protein
LDGEYWDLKGNNNYAFLLLKEMDNSDFLVEEAEERKHHLAALAIYYPATRKEVTRQLLAYVDSVQELNSLLNPAPPSISQMINQKKSVIKQEIIIKKHSDPIQPIKTNVPIRATISIHRSLPGVSQIMSEHLIAPDKKVTEPQSENVIKYISINEQQNLEQKAINIQDVLLSLSVHKNVNENQDAVDNAQQELKHQIDHDAIITYSDNDFILTGDQDERYREAFQKWLQQPDKVQYTKPSSIATGKQDVFTTYQIPVQQYYTEGPRLGTSFKKELQLTKHEEELLNRFYYFQNNFNDIDECKKYLVNVFIKLMRSLDKLYTREDSSLTKQVTDIAGLATSKIHRYRQGSNNYVDAVAQHTTDIYFLIFKVTENALREHYRHKRKLNADSPFDHLLVKEQLETKLFARVNEVLPALVKAVPTPSLATEKLLNQQNTTRWKLTFDGLEKQYLPQQVDHFFQQVLLLGEHNITNPSVEMIYFEAAKSVSKLSREISVKLFIYYYYHDLISETFDNRPLTKSFQKALFQQPEQQAEFENILLALAKSKDLTSALNASAFVFQPKRKKIKLDHTEISHVSKRHSETVAILNPIFQEETETHQTVDIQPVKDALTNTSTAISTVIDEKQDVSADNTLVNPIHAATLQLFIKANYIIAQSDIEEFATSRGLFTSQLINQINETYYDIIDDVLIEEEDDQYVINPEYYQKFFMHAR